MHFVVDNKTFTIARTKYGNGRIALVILGENGHEYACITVDLPQEHLEPDEIFVRTYPANEKMIPQILHLGIFEATRMSVKSDFAMVPIWRIANPRAFQSISEIDAATKSIARAAKTTSRRR